MMWGNLWCCSSISWGGGAGSGGSEVFSPWTLTLGGLGNQSSSNVAADEDSDHFQVRSLFLRWSWWHQKQPAVIKFDFKWCRSCLPGDLSWQPPVAFVGVSHKYSFPTANFHSRQCLFWCSFCCHCLIFTRSSKFGFSKSNCILRSHPKSSTAGDSEVVVWGVILYWRRNREILSEIVPAVSLLTHCLKILTAHSAC